MELNLSEIRKKTVSAGQYISELDQPFRDQLQSEATDQLRGLANNYVVVAFSAGW